MTKLLLLLTLTFFSYFTTYAIGGGSITVIEQELHVDTEGSELFTQITISHYMGAPVMQIGGNMETKQIVDISSLSAGTYLVFVQTNDGDFFSTIIYHP